jgi:hypothetical protein
MPFTDIAMVSMDPVDPLPAFVTTEWFDTLADEAIDVLIDATFTAAGPPPILFAEIRHAGGAIARLGVGAANERGRSGNMILEMVAVPMVPDAAPSIQEHLRATRQALVPYVTGAAYLNFTEGPKKQERTPDAFTAEHLRRIQALKAALDPENRFSHGFGIAPR